MRCCCGSPLRLCLVSTVLMVSSALDQRDRVLLEGDRAYRIAKIGPRVKLRRGEPREEYRPREAHLPRDELVPRYSERSIRDTSDVRLEPVEQQESKEWFQRVTEPQAPSGFRGTLHRLYMAATGQIPRLSRQAGHQAVREIAKVYKPTKYLSSEDDTTRLQKADPMETTQKAAPAPPRVAMKAPAPPDVVRVQQRPNPAKMDKMKEVANKVNMMTNLAEKNQQVINGAAKRKGEEVDPSLVRKVSRVEDSNKANQREVNKEEENNNS